MDPHNQYRQQMYSQAFDQSTQAYYASHYQQQQYPYANHPQFFPTTNYQHQEPPTSIHPPGVPIPPEKSQTHLPIHPNSYYPPPQQEVGASYAGFGHVPGGPQIVQPSYSGVGSTPYGGASRGHFGPRPHGSGPLRGRGRGRGRGRNVGTNSAASVTGVGGDPAAGYKQPTYPAPVWPPLSLAWCELCRVDCNTPEILEQHKNGKKHKKNLKVHEELQKLVQRPNEQTLNSELKLQTSNQTEKVEGSEANKLPEVSLSSQSVPTEKNVENEQQKKLVEAEQTEETARNSRMDNFSAQGHGSKRKMRGGRGGKFMRTLDGSRKPVEPPKPKEIIPLICELCNAKCESPIVFDSHLKGKKHLANVKRFQSQQEAALQVLYPAIQALYPTLQAIANNASTSFPPQFPQQGFCGPQSFITPGSSVLFQGQSSALGPQLNPASAPPVILETNGEQTTMLQDSASSQTQSQDEPLQFVRKDTDALGSNSVVVPQNTLYGTDQFSLGTKTGVAVGPDAEALSSDVPVNGEQNGVACVGKQKAAPSDQVAVPVNAEQTGVACVGEQKAAPSDQVAVPVNTEQTGVARVGE